MNKLNKTGHTVIELITAIVITLIILPLIFSAYLTIFKGFNLFTRKADNVMETVVKKKKIDALFSDIKTVSGAYKTTLEYLDKENNEKRILSFRNNAFYVGNRIEIDGISKFDYSISDKPARNGKNLLLWETVLLNNHWIGGVREVISE